MNIKYFTKSKFKLGLECPTKLFYVGKEIFQNIKIEDPFLEQLANGGFQVEALARLLYDHGTMISSKNAQQAADETKQLLSLEHSTTYEGAFVHDQLLARSDIVTKRNNTLKLIEVKAKSSRRSYQIEDEFFNKRDKQKVKSEWEAYLWDIAFQTFVARKSYPQFKISAHLLLIDKDAVASIDGVHQKFKINKSNSDKRFSIQVEQGLSYVSLGNSLLVEKDVTEIVNNILDGEIIHSNGLNFTENFKLLSENYLNDIEIHSLVGRKCKDCEFKLKSGQIIQNEKLSGFDRCWTHDGRVHSSELSAPKTYDIYNSTFSNKIMSEDGILLASHLNDVNLNQSSSIGLGYNRFDRQSMQLEDIKSGNKRIAFNYDAFKEYKDRIAFPLNMIDFETSAMALPFTKGMSPYETIAFQFSHHIIYQDGLVEHATQWLKTSPLSFPNFDFVRALQKALSQNNGSIFRYHNHENTVLNGIKIQLEHSQENDRDELIHFIESITSFEGVRGEKIVGNRCMIDLHRLISDCYYNTHFAHSLSLKAVLPAVIQFDIEIQNKYRQTIKDNGVSSLNFDQTHQWLKPEIDKGLDPYYLLPKPFDGFDDEQLSSFMSDGGDAINNGGTAMMAYSLLQFSEMDTVERDQLEQALLKYCETDTIAMVFLWEHLDLLYSEGIKH